MNTDQMTFNDAITNEKPRLPGQSAMLFFVIGDLWIFSCYFACYIYDRGQNVETYLASQQTLSQGIGVINTILLLTSSLFVALSVHAARTGSTPKANRLLILGGACGIGFLLIKAVEWYIKISSGLPIGSGEFFLYYFMFTGLHFLHVTLGLIILSLVYHNVNTSTNPDITLFESGATYWHMVDLLWILIFALLYLLA